MPRRSRSHEIEAESRAAFQTALPSRWVVRPINNEYGIDDQVELFEGGLATGRTFLAQNKGTDEPDLAKALAVRLNLTTVSYAAEQDVPVLLVRYHTPTRTLYAKWFHAFDILLKRPDQKTVTYRLSDADKWTGETPERLAAEVERWRRLRLGDFSLPVTLCLEITSSVGRIPPVEAELAIKGEAARVSELLAIRSGAASADEIPIAIDEEVIHINRRGSRTLSVHHPNLDYDRTDTQRFVTDFFSAVGCWLGQVGEVAAAATLLTAYAANSSLIHDPELALRAASFFVRARNFDGLIGLIETLENRELPGDRPIADLLEMALASSPSMTPVEVERIERFFVARAEAGTAAGDIRRARVAYYNAGSLLRAQGLFRDAFAHYWTAVECDPSYYPSRRYFLEELGGILFQLGSFDHASDLYQRAIAMEFDPNLSALLGDALMFAGRYADARDAFERYLEGVTGEVDPEFALKWALLPRLSEIAGSTQDRRRPEAESLLADIADVDEEKVPALLVEAISLDALSPNALYNSGIRHAREGNSDEALDWFLLSGLCNAGDADAWAKAMALAVSIQDTAEGVEADTTEAEDAASALPYLIFRAAVNAANGPFIDRLREMWSHNAEFLRALADLVETVPPKSIKPPTIRLVGDGPDYENLFDSVIDDD